MSEYKKAIVKVTMDFNNPNHEQKYSLKEGQKTLTQDKKIKDCESNGLVYNFSNGGNYKEHKYGPENRLVAKFENGKKGGLGFQFKDL